MSANKSVIVLVPNGRRQTVKVTPNTTILQILEEVCQKHGYNVDDYDIKHLKHVLDTNAILRFTGLPNNAQLEMVPCTKVRSMSNVVIGVQLENGQRLTGEFTPDNTLQDVLRRVNLNENVENTILIYMHREMYGLDVFENTTLKSLGLNSGRAVLRLIHRDPHELKTQAHIGNPLKPKAKSTDTNIAGPSNNNNRAEIPSTSGCDHPVIGPITLKKDKIFGKGEPKDFGDITRNKKEEIIMKSENDKGNHNCRVEEVQPTTSIGQSSSAIGNEVPCEGIEEINAHVIEFLGDRNALVFNQAGSKALPQDELPDNFYDLTVDDAKVLLRDVKRRREELDEAPFLTEAQRRLNQEKRTLNQLHKYQRTVIRIQFPDQYVLQGLFGPLETIETVKNFIRSYLTEPDSEFVIYTTPPKCILNTNARLVDENLVPSAIVYYSGSSPLKTEIKAKAVDPKDAGIQAIKVRMATLRQESRVSTKNTANNNASSKIQKKTPTWFAK